jgi:hypothetical protein
LSIQRFAHLQTCIFNLKYERLPHLERENPQQEDGNAPASSQMKISSAAEGFYYRKQNEGKTQSRKHGQTDTGRFLIP